MHETGYYSAEDHRIWGHFFSEPLAGFAAEFFDRRFPVADLGCGQGRYCRFLADRGFQVTGYEGSPRIASVAKFDRITTLNLAYPADIGRAQVLCLEVGEHIPETYAQTLFNNIGQTAKHRAIISWAIPGQPGNGHVNCQPNSYVISQLEKRGLRFLPKETQAARLLPLDTVAYYRNTLMVFEGPA